MAKYRISGIWKNNDGIITHYAFHTVNSDNSVTRAAKIAKAEAVKIVESANNTVHTRLWNYTKAKWNVGEKVDVVNGKTGKYLRSNPDNKLTDNLEHLIDFDWILP